MTSALALEKEEGRGSRREIHHARCGRSHVLVICTRGKVPVAPTHPESYSGSTIAGGGPCTSTHGPRVAPSRRSLFCGWSVANLHRTSLLIPLLPTRTPRRESKLRSQLGSVDRSAA